MKALREIGVGRAVRYVLGAFFSVIFAAAIVPPLRVLVLRLGGARIGRNVVIDRIRLFNLYRMGLPAIRIGDCCYLGDDTLLDLAERITLGDHVTIAERVIILTHLNVGYKDHPLQPCFPARAAAVTIERGAFVGANATILCGVTIGECAFVAAGAVVTKDVPSWTLVGGVPARVIRHLKAGQPAPEPSC